MPPPKSHFRIYVEDQVKLFWEKNKEALCKEKAEKGITRSLVLQIHSSLFENIADLVERGEFGDIKITSNPVTYRECHGCKLYRTIEKVLYTLVSPPPPLANITSLVFSARPAINLCKKAIHTKLKIPGISKSSK